MYPTSLYQSALFAVNGPGVEAEFNKEDTKRFRNFSIGVALNDVFHRSLLELTQGSVGFESSV